MRTNAELVRYALLRGTDSPYLVMCCDVYDALRSRRPYKPAFEHEKSLDIITVGDGRTMPGHFDPEVFAAFSRRAERFREIFEERKDEE